MQVGLDLSEEYPVSNAYPPKVILPATYTSQSLVSTEKVYLKQV